MSNPAPKTPWVMALGPRSFLAFVCAAAAVGGLLFGFDTAVISGTVSLVETQYGLSGIQVGWFGSSALMGCIPGALLAGWLGDRLGRRPVMLEWLDRAHCADKARKRGVFVGPGDLASVLPNHTGPSHWTGSDAQLQQLEAVLAAIARWKRARRLG